MTLACNYDLTLTDRVVQVFPSIHADTVSADCVFLERLRESLRIQLRQQQLASSKEIALSLWKLMALLGGDLFARMRDWLKGALGRADYSASIIAEQWDAFLAELK